MATNSDLPSRRNFLRSLSVAECNICTRSFDINHLSVELPCGHQFGEPCVKRWLAHSNTCPYCRTTLFEETNGDKQYEDEAPLEDEDMEDDDTPEIEDVDDINFPLGYYEFVLQHTGDRPLTDEIQSSARNLWRSFTNLGSRDFASHLWDFIDQDLLNNQDLLLSTALRAVQQFINRRDMRLPSEYCWISFEYVGLLDRVLSSWYLQTLLHPITSLLELMTRVAKSMYIFEKEGLPENFWPDLVNFHRLTNFSGKLSWQQFEDCASPSSTDKRRMELLNFYTCIITCRDILLDTDPRTAFDVEAKVWSAELSLNFCERILELWQSRQWDRLCDLILRWQTTPEEIRQLWNIFPPRRPTALNY